MKIHESKTITIYYTKAEKLAAINQVLYYKKQGYSAEVIEADSGDSERPLCHQVLRTRDLRTIGEKDLASTQKA